MKTCYKVLRKSLSHLTRINCNVFTIEKRLFLQEIETSFPLTILQRYVIIKEAT